MNGGLYFAMGVVVGMVIWEYWKNKDKYQAIAAARKANKNQPKVVEVKNDNINENK